MKRSLLNLASYVIVVLAPVLSARADYSNAVVSLNAAAYWPLNETTQPPAIYLATNSGSIGALGNGYYNNVYTLSGTNYTLNSYFTGPVSGVTSDGDKASFFNGGTSNNNNSGFMIIPDINHAVDTPGPFTAEI